VSLLVVMAIPRYRRGLKPRRAGSRAGRLPL
jgi:hypothetical protein